MGLHGDGGDGNTHLIAHGLSLLGKYKKKLNRSNVFGQDTPSHFSGGGGQESLLPQPLHTNLTLLHLNPNAWRQRRNLRASALSPHQLQLHAVLCSPGLRETLPSSAHLTWSRPALLYAPARLLKECRPQLSSRAGALSATVSLPRRATAALLHA